MLWRRPDDPGIAADPALQAAVSAVACGPNNAERLRRLLLELYHAEVLNPLDASDAEHVRLLDTVLAAAEGGTFEPLGLPFPRERAPYQGCVITLPALPAGWVYVAVPESEALLDCGPPYGPQ